MRSRVATVCPSSSMRSPSIFKYRFRFCSPFSLDRAWGWGNRETSLSSFARFYPDDICDNPNNDLLMIASTQIRRSFVKCHEFEMLYRVFISSSEPVMAQMDLCVQRRVFRQAIGTKHPIFLRMEHSRVIQTVGDKSTAFEYRKQAFVRQSHSSHACFKRQLFAVRFVERFRRRWQWRLAYADSNTCFRLSDDEYFHNIKLDKGLLKHLNHIICPGCTECEQAKHMREALISL